MRVAILPLDIEILNPSVNFSRVEESLCAIDRSSDILVLPELFSTGFSKDAQSMADVAETNDGRTMQFVRSVAHSMNMAVAGTFLARTDDKLYNRAFFAEPFGDIYFYDKHNLFTLGAEHEILTAGTKRGEILRFRGWNILMVTCYDLRFPEWCRNDRQSKYDLLLVPANWPSARGHAWRTLLQARAIENVAYVVGANRSGEEGEDNYNDQTFAFNFLGKPCTFVYPGYPGIYADLDKAALKRFREKFPVLDQIKQDTK